MNERITKYDLGIIGGMGSEASVELYRRIVDQTLHSCDQEHMKICILNNSIIPDRTDCIINGSTSPVPYLNESIKDLEALKVKYFVIACNTAHAFLDKIDYKKDKLINMIDVTLKYVRENYNNRKVCIISTTGTNASKVYYENKYSKGIDFVYLSDNNQKNIMKCINDTKNDENRDVIFSSIIKVIDEMYQMHNCIFVLACTEMSLYKERLREKYPIVDAMDCLVSEIIKKCGYKHK